LYQVVGAPGVGKTTVLPELVRLGQGTGIVVMEQDELFEDGALLGLPITDPDAGPPYWPAYNRMWDRIIHIVRRAGHPVLMLSGTPSPADDVADDDAEGPVRWALLDCADDLRLSRLRARGWPTEWIDDAMCDADQSRPRFPTVIRTDGADAAEVAGRILSWAATALRQTT
jgi:AAA domain